MANDTGRRMLPHDKSGFLVGERLVSGMDAVKSDTDEILSLLRSGLKRGEQADGKAQRSLDAIQRNTRDTRSMASSRNSGGGASGGITRAAREAGGPAAAGRSGPGRAGAGGDGRERQRNERGQFMPSGRSDAEKAEKSEAARTGILASLVSAVRGRFGLGGAPDAENLDPTLTAIHEAGQLVGPFARVGGMMFKAGGWLVGRFKKKDDVPKEQRRHNRLIEKLLKPLGFLLRGGGAGLGLLGAWMGGQAIGKWIYDKFEPQIAAVADAIGSTVKTAIAAYDKAVSSMSGWIEKIANLLHLGDDQKPMTTEEFKSKWPVRKVAGNPAGKDRYNAIMAEEYARQGFTPDQMAMLKGMVHVESGFNPNAVSPTGAFGLGQHMPATAGQYKVLRGDSEQAARSQIRGEAQYMKSLLGQFGGDWDKARAAYNWGPGNLQKAIKAYGDDWRLHLPRETSDYLRKTKVYASKYTGEFGQAQTIGSGYRANGDDAIPDFGMIGARAATRVIAMPVPSASSAPGVGVLKIPPAPKVQQQVGGNKGWTVVNAGVGGGDISQNVADRALAHALTGGLGMDNMRGN